MKEILKICDYDEIKKFIAYLLSEIATSPFSLIILISEKLEYLDKTQQGLLDHSLSLFVNPIFNKSINLLSHPLRKNIIILLKSEERLNFNKIVKKLNVERSSVLAFPYRGRPPGVA